MNLELKLLTGISRSLPSIKGAGRIGHLVEDVYLRKARPRVEVPVLDFRMALEPAEEVDRHLLFIPQLYDRKELAYLRSNLPKDGCFIDVGSHIGFYSLSAARTVGPRGKVVAFEANPVTFKRLKENIHLSDCQNIKAVNAGVADAPCTLKLGVGHDGNAGANSFLATEGPTVEVECLPLLDLLNEHGITRVDGAKFDIEGFEFRVLKAFLATAPRSIWPVFIIIEDNPEYHEAAGGDAIALLTSAGYAEVESVSFGPLRNVILRLPEA